MLQLAFAAMGLLQYGCGGSPLLLHSKGVPHSEGSALGAQHPVAYPLPAPLCEQNANTCPVLLAFRAMQSSLQLSQNAAQSLGRGADKLQKQSARVKGSVWPVFDLCAAVAQRMQGFRPAPPSPPLKHEQLCTPGSASRKLTEYLWQPLHPCSNLASHHGTSQHRTTQNGESTGLGARSPTPTACTQCLPETNEISLIMRDTCFVGKGGALLRTNCVQPALCQ